MTVVGLWDFYHLREKNVEMLDTIAGVIFQIEKKLNVEIWR